MYIGLHLKYPLFLSDFNETWIFWTNFRILKNQISLNSVQWEPSCCTRAYGCDGNNRSFSSFCERAQKCGNPFWTQSKMLHAMSFRDILGIMISTFFHLLQPVTPWKAMRSIHSVAFIVTNRIKRNQTANSAILDDEHRPQQRVPYYWNINGIHRKWVNLNCFQHQDWSWMQ